MAGLPSTMRAIVLKGPGQLSVQKVPVPNIQPGSVLVKVEAALVHSNSQNIINAALPHFKQPYPVIPGSNFVGRVVVPGPDAVTLEQDQLVFVHSFLRARDDPSVQVLWGISPGFTTESSSLYNSTARNGAYAEYVLAPLENTFALDEAQLLGHPAAGGLGYKIPDLLYLATGTIAYGSLRNIGLQAGERIIVTPATGFFSAAAVDVATAMGANVIAASRNAQALARLKATHSRLETAQLTGNLEADSDALSAFGLVDAVIDVSPPAATGSNSLAAAASTLRPYGHISLSGGRMDETLPIPYLTAMVKSLRIQGTFMFQREDQLGVIRLIESGLLKLGSDGGHAIVATYSLEELDEALEKAAEVSGPGQMVCLRP